MDEQELKQLWNLLDKYYEHNEKTCRHDCYNCGLGILEGYGYSHSCAIETVANIVYEDLKCLR